MDWRNSNNWLVNITMPDRILVGKNLGRKKQTQVTWGTYLEFFSRFAFQGKKILYENFELLSGLDFRTPIKGKLYLNAFVGNNFYKNIILKNSRLDRLENTATFSGLNARIGISLNLQE